MHIRQHTSALLHGALLWPAVWVSVVLAPVAAVAGPLSCIANSGVPPILNSASSAAQVGDAVLSCTGGVPGTPFPVIFDAVLNVPVIAPGGWTLSDGVNTYSGILRTGTNNDIEYQNVPFNPPGTGTSNYRISNIFVNPSVYAGDPVGSGVFQYIEAISDSASIPISNPQVTVGYEIPAALTNFQGSAGSSPTLLPSGELVGSISGSIGGLGSQNYYSFFWPGGVFSATASLTNVTGSTSSYLFSQGVAGTCDSGGSMTLNTGDSFTGTITNSNLLGGLYCIGLYANNPVDPNFTLTFNTPVSNPAPEPAGFVLMAAGLGMIAALRLRKRAAR